MYGEQALKSGMAEREPGIAADLWYSCDTIAKPPCVKTDSGVQQAQGGVDIRLTLSLVLNRSSPVSLAHPTHMRH